jgi:2-polyprenyl-3-methyl-5-hydroxy-6-metoxy-1,4-benzoquinol methylase
LTIDNQDFDSYADLKRFNANVSCTWDVVLMEALRQLVKPPEEVMFLDYGCGDGKYFSHLLTKRGLKAANVHGVEVAARRVSRCHEIGWANARLITSHVKLPYPDSCFDIVNMMEVIEHIPSDRSMQTICDIRRVLRPGGMLLISTPNYPIKRFYDLYDAIFHGFYPRFFDDPTHVSRFNHRRLQTLLGPHFNLVESRRFKPGFLYKYFKAPFLEHKLFYLCRV